MPLRIKDERALLDESFRAKVIEDIEGSENHRRKEEQFKRYLVYKDQTPQLVKAMLELQFDQDTVIEMQYAITNVSIGRKIIDKLARVYNNGVIRTLEKKSETKKLDKLAKKLKANTKFKKTNQFLKLHKNDLLETLPELMDNGKWTVRFNNLRPYLYDVIEDQRNRERIRCYIKSDFNFNQLPKASHSPETEGRTSTRNAEARALGGALSIAGDGKDQIIADSPLDAIPDIDKKEYVWWSDTYHFTTNFKGVILKEISPDDLKNPIQIMPAVNFAEDQDNAFWAIGGNDIVDSSVLINCLITHTNHIAVTQGYGQLVVTGSKLAGIIKVGVNKMIKLVTKEGQPSPTAQYISANPPLEQHMNLVEQQTALLLSTNNLSISSVKSTLSGDSAFPSGIAMLIDSSESRDDVRDQEAIFHEKEPEAWDRINRWLMFYNDKGILDEGLVGLILTDTDVKLKFNKPELIVSEEERLRTLKARKELGISLMVELLMMDDPEMSKEDAEKKLIEINEEKMKNMLAFAGGMGGNPNNPEDPKVKADEQNQDPNRKQVGAKQEDLKRGQVPIGDKGKESTGAKA